MSESFFFEYGIPFPTFHIDFFFPPKKEIQDPIKFPKVTHNLKFSRTGFNGRLKVLRDNTFCLYQDGYPHLTIIGDHNITVYLKTRIKKIESTPTHVYIKTRKLFISYDYTSFKVWDIEFTDFCTVGDYLYIMQDNLLSTFKGEECTKRTKLHESMKFIRGHLTNLLVCTKYNKVYLIDNLYRGRLVYDNGKVNDITLYKNYVLVQKSTNLVVVDIANKKMEVIKNTRKLVVSNDLIIISEQRGCFKYVEIGNLQNTKTVLYDEIIGGIDIYDEKVFVLTRNGIYHWDKTEKFIGIKIVWPTLNIFNRIFYEHSLFREEKKEEKVECIDMSITELIKEEQKSKKKKEEKKDVSLNIKKRVSKKGGF